MAKLIFTFSLIVLGLSCGYIYQKLYNNGVAPFSFSIESFQKKLQKSTLMFFSPIAILGGTWIIRLDRLRMVALPFMGILLIFIGGFLALFAARYFQLTRKQTGSYILSGACSNTGAIGALVCFIYLGEAGFAVVPLFRLLELFVFFGIGFPLAKSYSLDVSEKASFLVSFKKAFTDIFVIIFICSVSIGLLLNLSEIQRPEIYKTINAIFIPTGSFLLLSSIGMGMKFSKVSVFFKESLLISVIKFILLPGIMVSIGYFLGLGKIDNGLPLQVVLILSSMPVAFISMVPPTLYDLDIDLSNSCWLTSNFLMIIEIPVLMFLIQLF
ncbi:AEC family transporter [Thermodesulfobacteriota bacterium]